MLFGTWEREGGDTVWFFWRAQFIEFFIDDDGTFAVMEYDDMEYGVWYIDGDGYLIVEGEESGYREFYIEIGDDYLIIIDEDGDMATYIRAS